MFDRKGINIKLKAAGYSVLMIARNDYAAEGYMVVFADIEKLKGYVDRENAFHHAGYLRGKKQSAQEGIVAALTDSPEPFPIPGPKDNPLPMAKVNCFISGGEPFFSFTDGLARTTELICQQAECVPLQISSEEAALLHKLVGCQNRRPVSVMSFEISSDERHRLLLEYSKHRYSDTRPS